MGNYTVIQAHTVLLLLLAFLLTAICSYAWTSRRIQAQRSKAKQPRSGFPALTGLYKRVSAKRISCHPFIIRCAKSTSSLAGEWLAPLIAWIVVTMAAMAIVDFMLAEQ